MRKLLLLRPDPGLSASAERATAMGLEVVCCPLFRIEPVEWVTPDPDGYQALLLTSANTVRHAGHGLHLFRSLPVHAVGEATAAAAREMGFRVETVGRGDVADLLAELPTSLRLLWLGGEIRQEPPGRDEVDMRIVYRSAPIEAPELPPLGGLVAAVHSPRTGQRLAELANTRDRTAIAAISEAAAKACGPGWERVEIAERPEDSSLLALAATLCHTSPPA